MVWMINESSPRRKVLTDSVAKIIVAFLLQQKSVYTTAAFFLLGWWPNRRRPLSRALRGYLCLLWMSLMRKSKFLFSWAQRGMGWPSSAFGWKHLGNVRWCLARLMSHPEENRRGVAPLPCMQRYHSLSPAWGHQMFLPTDLTDSPSQQR